MQETEERRANEVKRLQSLAEQKAWDAKMEKVEREKQQAALAQAHEANLQYLQRAEDEARARQAAEKRASELQAAALPRPDVRAPPVFSSHFKSEPEEDQHPAPPPAPLPAGLRDEYLPPPPPVRDPQLTAELAALKDTLRQVVSAAPSLGPSEGPPSSKPKSAPKKKKAPTPPSSSDDSESSGDSDASSGDSSGTHSESELAHPGRDRGPVVDRNIHIPNFTGSEPARAWFDTFEELCAIQNVRSKSRKKAWLVSRLKNGALDWYLGRRALARRTKNKKMLTYKRLRRAIIKKWDGNPDRKVRDLKQVRCEGRSAKAVATFAKEFAEKYHVVEDEMRPREVKEQFLKKLPAELADKVRTIDDRKVTPDSLFDRACAIIQGQEDARQEAPRMGMDRPQNPNRIKCPSCFRWRERDVKCPCGAPAQQRRQEGNGANRKPGSFKPRTSEGVVEEAAWDEQEE